MKLQIEIPPEEWERKLAEDSGLKLIAGARQRLRNKEQKRLREYDQKISLEFAELRKAREVLRRARIDCEIIQRKIQLLNEQKAFRPAPIRKLEVRERNLKMRLRRRMLAEATIRAAKGLSLNPVFNNKPLGPGAKPTTHETHEG